MPHIQPPHIQKPIIQQPDLHPTEIHYDLFNAQVYEEEWVRDPVSGEMVKAKTLYPFDNLMSHKYKMYGKAESTLQEMASKNSDLMQEGVRVAISGFIFVFCALQPPYGWLLIALDIPLFLDGIISFIGSHKKIDNLAQKYYDTLVSIEDLPPDLL